MDTLCFYILVSTLLASAHCSVENSTKTEKNLEKLFISDDSVQVQNLFVANCENIKEDINSVKNSLMVQDKQMQCMESSVEEIHDIANKTSGYAKNQKFIEENLVSSLATLNSSMVAQEKRSKNIVMSLEAQRNRLQTLITLVKNFATEKTETVVMTCPEGFEEFQGKCYRFYKDIWKTWSEALGICQTAGGFLAEPKTKQENDFIRDNASKGYIWYGGTDQSREGEWRWASDGDIISGFTNWGTYQPRNYSGYEDCLMANIRFDWSAVACHIRNSLVCQTAKSPSSSRRTNKA